MGPEWAECKLPGCHAACDPSEEFCAVHRETMRTGEPMDIAWQFLKAWPEDPSDEPVSHLPLMHPARSRHRRQAARTGGIEGLEGTMAPEFSSDLAEQDELMDRSFAAFDEHDRLYEEAERAEEENKRLRERVTDLKAPHTRGYIYDPPDDPAAARAIQEADEEWGRAEEAAWRARRREEDWFEDKLSTTDGSRFRGPGFDRPPGKTEMRRELEPVSREEALASEGAEMPAPQGYEEEEEPEPDRSWTPQDIGYYLRTAREMDKPPTTAQTQGRAGGLSREQIELLGRQAAMRRR